MGRNIVNSRARRALVGGGAVVVSLIATWSLTDAGAGAAAGSTRPTTTSTTTTTQPAETEIKNDTGNAITVTDGAGDLTVDGTVGIDPTRNDVQDATRTIVVDDETVFVVAGEHVVLPLDVAPYKTLRVVTRSLPSSDCSTTNIEVEGGAVDHEFVLQRTTHFLATASEWTETYEFPGTTLRISFDIQTGDTRTYLPCQLDVAVYGRAN